MLPGDGIEYDLLTDAASRTVAPGLICEVGCRLGGGIAAIIEGLALPRVILSIDPYGDVEYAHSDQYPRLYESGYSHGMLVQAMTTIPAACHDKGHLWLPFIMEDSEFFHRFADGVPVYASEKFVANEYALVHLDGPHRTDKVLEETEFFAPRVPVGGAIAYDNWTYFDFRKIGHTLVLAGFEKESQGEEKMVWRKVA